MACEPGWVPADPYRGHRFPEVIISQCVWLYFNFCLSLRDVELMMAARGVQLSYETRGPAENAMRLHDRQPGSQRTGSRFVDPYVSAL